MEHDARAPPVTYTSKDVGEIGHTAVPLKECVRKCNSLDEFCKSVSWTTPAGKRVAVDVIPGTLGKCTIFKSQFASPGHPGSLTRPRCSSIPPLAADTQAAVTYTYNKPTSNLGWCTYTRNADNSNRGHASECSEHTNVHACNSTADSRCTWVQALHSARPAKQLKAWHEVCVPNREGAHPTADQIHNCSTRRGCPTRSVGQEYNKGRANPKFPLAKYPCEKVQHTPHVCISNQNAAHIQRRKETGTEAEDAQYCASLSADQCAARPDSGTKDEDFQYMCERQRRAFPPTFSKCDNDQDTCMKWAKVAGAAAPLVARSEFPATPFGDHLVFGTVVTWPKGGGDCETHAPNVEKTLHPVACAANSSEDQFVDPRRCLCNGFDLVNHDINDVSNLVLGSEPALLA